MSMPRRQHWFLAAAVAALFVPTAFAQKEAAQKAPSISKAVAKQVNADLHGWEDSLGLSGAERSNLAGAIGRLTEAIDGAPDRMASPVS